MKPFRIPPNLPVGAYQTYSLTAPRDTTVRAACEQVGCDAWRCGWETVIDETDLIGQTRAGYIRTQSGRTFTEMRRADGMTVFRFASGQRCFAEHRTRPEFYAVRGGDWRLNLGLIRRHTRPADWVEDMGENLQIIADQQQRG